MKIFYGIALAILSSTCYASSEWVPLGQPQIITQQQVITIVQPQVPKVVIKYQLVPQVVFETVEVERRYVFRTVTEVTKIPVTRWVYQPYYVIE